MPRRESICCCRFDLFACWFTAALFGFAAFFFGAPLAPAGFFAFLTGFFFSFFLSSARRRLTSSSRDMSTFVSTLVMAIVRLASRRLGGCCALAGRLLSVIFLSAARQILECHGGLHGGRPGVAARAGRIDEARRTTRDEHAQVPTAEERHVGD